MFGFGGKLLVTSNMIRLTTIASAVGLALGTGAFAESTSYGGFVHLEQVPNALFLNGEISTNGSFELRRAMRDHDIKLVVVASPGGNLYEGLQIAAILHDKGIGTYVPEVASCESSCATVFLGGTNRMLLGELGVHQFYSGSDDAYSDAPQNVTTAVTQYTTSDIIGILNEFDTPPFVYEKMFGTTDIYYFKPSEKVRLDRNSDDASFIANIEAVDAFLESTPELLTRPEPKPAAPASASVDIAPHSEPSVAAVQAGALEFLVSMNNDWSLPNEIALPRIAEYYAPAVEFYGNTLSHSEVLHEKFTFAERWPVRSYSVEPESVEIRCTSGGCIVDSVIEWQASSPARGANASGYSTWTLVLVPVGEGMLIASESGKTLKRN
jgi:hypothetical protein